MFTLRSGTRSKLGKRVRRKTVSTFTSLAKKMLAPVGQTKRKSIKKTKTPKKTRKDATANQDRAIAGTVTRKKPAAKRLVPATSHSRSGVPVGASFQTGTHICDFGKRSFRLYIPGAARLAKEPLPLLVMLHGCKQTPEDFARGTGMNVLAEEFGFLVVYPAQERRAHISRCWNWYKPEDQARNMGEPALLASLVRDIIEVHGADPARVYVAGLSAGASAALILSTRYPDIFAAVGAHSGLPSGAAHDGASAVIAMRQGAPGLHQHVAMPTIVFHGDADKVVNPRNGRFVASRALEPYPDLGKTERSGQVTDGRGYVRTFHCVGKGRPYIEHWVVLGSGHGWSGGHSAGSFTDPAGPDASREMVRFFLRHRTTKQRRAGRGL